MPAKPDPKPDRSLPPEIDLDDVVAGVRAQMREARRDGLRPHRILLPYSWKISLDGQAGRRRGDFAMGLRHIYETPVQFRQDIHKPVLEAYRPLEMRRYLVAVGR